MRHAGAYCEAIASRFNGRLSPPTVVLGDADGDEIVAERRREDPFFEPGLQTYRPTGLDRGGDAGNPTEDTGDEIPAERLGALQSEYMHRLAEEEGYDISRANSRGEGAYSFLLEPRAPTGFVALPLGLRMVGDASIIAVGAELGWSKKERPVWASRLTLVAARLLETDGEPIPCRVVVSRLAPGRKERILHQGHVHFELGAEAEIRGTAQVSLVDDVG